MRLSDVRRWNHQTWTQLYEAALFERDTVKLWALIWNAQLAILRREHEIQTISPADKRETVALKKAFGILRDLGQLSGLDVPLERTIEFARANSSNVAPPQSRSRSTTRRSDRSLLA
jgi:hypothetical protein